MNLRNLTIFLLIIYRAFNANSQGCPELILDAGSPQTVCSGEEVVLGGAPTATWTGTGNPSLNYEWVDSNNDVVSNDPNPTVQIDQNETFTLTVDDGNGCSESISLNISIFAVPPTPSLVLTNSAQQGYQTNVYNGEIYFSKCNNTSGGNFNIIDNQNYPNGTTFEIDWGDGSPISANLQPHVYTTGEYDLTYSVITAEGCVFVYQYNVLVGGPPPALTLSGSGSSSCIPNLYEISIGAGSDPPGTTYNIIINDGSQDTTLIGLNPNPYVFSHLFQQSSCGTNSTIQNNTYPDSYSIQVVSSNGCSPQGTFSAIGPIQVSESTDAQFSASSSEVCVDGIVNFQNNSDPGTNINSLGCDSLSAFYWEISPNIGYTVVNGDLGSSNGFLDNVIYYDYFEWTSGSENLDVEFNVEGVYDITLYTGNGCGIDSVTQQICVLPQPTPDFQLSDDFFCTSEIVSVTNNSTGDACGITFESNWQINYSNPQNCSPNSGVSFINSTSNSSFEPVLDFQGPGGYEVILTVSYPGNIPGCTMPQLSDSVNVIAPPEIQLIPQGANVCEGELVQFTGVVDDCYALPTDYSWSFEDIPGIIISDTLTLNPSVQYGVSGVFDYSLEASNQCGSVIIIDSVNVGPGVIVDAGPDQATCLNTQVNLNGSITGGASTGVWSANIPGGQFSDPNALNSSYTPPVNFSGQIILSLISDDPIGPCPGNSDFLVLTINDEAVIDAMPDLSVCEGDVVDLNSTIQGAASEGIWSDAGAGGQIINEDLSSGTAQYIPPIGVAEVWLYVETNVPSVFCPADLDSVLITIISTPTVSIIPDQVVCNGLSTQSAVFAGTGTQYSWTNTDGSIGLGTSGIGDIGSFIATNNGQVPVTSLVTVTPEYVNGGLTCSGSPTVYNYTINPTPVVDPIGDQELCIGDQSQVVIFSGTATNYTWSNDNTSTGAPISGLNSVPSFIAQNTSNQVITSNITVTPESNGCIGIPTDFAYTINPITNVNPINDSIFCNGEQVTSYVISGSASSYSWVNDNPSIGLSSAGNGNIPSFTAVNNTSQPIDATITITPEFTGTTNSCLGNSYSFTITVQPSPIVNPIIDQTICNGSSTQTVQFSGTNASSYQWVNDNSLIGLAPSGSGNINSFTATNTSSSAQVSTITVIPQLSVNGLICFGAPEDFLITVNPSPSVDPLSDIIVCEGQQVPITLLSGNATSFDWISSTNNTGVGAGGIGNIPSFTALNGTSQPVSDQITVTPNFTGSGLSCPGVTSSFIITVNPVPIVDPILDQVLCNGSSTIEVIFTGDATNYTWTNDLSAIGLAQTGSGNIPAFTVGNSTSFPIDASITVTPEFTSGGITCLGNPESFNISAVPTPEVDPLADIVVCSSSDIGPIQFSGVATNYEWTNSNSAIGLAAGGNGNISIFSYNNQGNSSESATIAVTPQYDYQGLSCIGTQESFLITVLPEPNLDPTNDFTYCNGVSTSPINFNGLATDFSWTNDNLNIGLGSSGVGDILSFTAVNNSLSPEISTITVTSNYTEAGLTCSGTSDQFTITVNPAPIINSVNDITVCNGDLVPLVDFSGNATTFEWFNDNTSIGLPSSGVGDIAAFTAVNNTAVPIVATINVVSSFSSNGVNCPGPSETFTITVNPTPIVNPLVDQIICNAAPSATVNFTGSGNMYTWTNDNPNIGLVSNGSGDISSFTALNPTTNPISGTITVIPTALQCDGSAEIFTITVNPTPTVDPLSDIENCAGFVQSSIQPTGNYSALNWVNNNTTIGLVSSGNTTIPSFTLSNTSNSTPNTAVVSVTPVNTNQGVQCFGSVIDFQITVNPIPENNVNPDIELCNGDLTPVIQLSGSGSYYDWTNDNTTIGLGLSGTGDIASFSAINNQSVDNISNISVIPVFVSNTGQLCEGTANSFTITVHPSPVIDPLTDVDVCNGDDFNVPVLTSVQSIITWSAQDNPDVTGESTFVQTTPVVSNTLNNSSSNIATVNYTINATSVPFGCAGLAQSLDVNVIPDVFITSGNNMEICSGVSASVFLTANVPSDFTWFATDNPNVSGESTVINNGNVINDVLINTTNIPQIVVYSVIPTSLQGGCQGQAQTVTVIVNPPIELISPLSKEICSGDFVDLQLVANANVTFNWFAQSSLEVNGESLTVQNGNLINDQLINTTTATQTVIYTVVATTTANGCSSPSTQINIFVNPLPIVTPFSEEICSGETLAIALGASSPSIFSWFATDNIDVTGETQSLQTNSVITDQLINSTNNSETVTYNIQATSNKGCLGPVNTGEVIVHPIPEVDFSVSNTTLCDLSPVNFVNNSSNLLDFDWDFGDGNTSTDFEPTHTYGVTGSYLVTLTGTDPVTLCEGSSSESILIQESPPIDFTVNLNEGCVPSTFIFSDLVNAPGVDLFWQFGDGEVSNQSGAVDHTYSDPGCYPVTLTATNSAGCISTITYDDMVCVYANPVANFTAEETIVPSDDPYVYFINNSLNAVTYEWDFGDGATSVSSDPIHLYPEGPATYYPLLTAYNEAGCSDQFTLPILLWEEELFYVPNSFTPNTDGTNEDFKPIITSGFDKGSYNLKIFNRWGEIVFESYNTEIGWDGTYGVNNPKACQDGTYTWKITLRGLQDEDATVYTGHVNLLR